jgi:hypothetical protein
MKASPSTVVHEGHCCTVLYGHPRTASTAPQIRISPVALVQNTGGALSGDRLYCKEWSPGKLSQNSLIKKKRGGRQGDERPRDDPSNASASGQSSLYGTHPHLAGRCASDGSWAIIHWHALHILHRARTSLALLLSYNNKAFLTRGRFIGNGMKPKPKKKKSASRTPPFFFFLFFFFPFRQTKRQTGQCIAVC